MTLSFAIIGSIAATALKFVNNARMQDRWNFVFKCKKFLDKILTPKPVVSTVPKKELIITLPYLGKLSLQMRTRINRIMKNKLPYCNVQFVFQTKDKIPSALCSDIVYKFQCGSCNATYYGKTKHHFAKLVTFLHLKTKFHWSCVLALFINFSAVAAMLPIMAKLSVIFKSECVNTWEFLHSLGKELKEMMILPLKSTFYSAITHPILRISQCLLPTTTTLKLR